MDDMQLATHFAAAGLHRVESIPGALATIFAFLVAEPTDTAGTDLARAGGTCRTWRAVVVEGADADRWWEQACKLFPLVAKFKARPTCTLSWRQLYMQRKAANRWRKTRPAEDLMQKWWLSDDSSDESFGSDDEHSATTLSKADWQAWVRSGILPRRTMGIAPLEFSKFLRSLPPSQAGPAPNSTAYLLGVEVHICPMPPRKLHRQMKDGTSWFSWKEGEEGDPAECPSKDIIHIDVEEPGWRLAHRAAVAAHIIRIPPPGIPGRRRQNHVLCDGPTENIVWDDQHQLFMSAFILRKRDGKCVTLFENETFSHGQSGWGGLHETVFNPNCLQVSPTMPLEATLLSREHCGKMRMGGVRVEIVDLENSLEYSECDFDFEVKTISGLLRALESPRYNDRWA
jgi:hypothetical protein